IYLHGMRVLTTLVLSLFFLHTAAQKKLAIVNGRVIDENENPLPRVSVIILGKINGVITNDSGAFSIKVPVEKAFAITFSHTGYNAVEKHFYLSENEKEKVVIRMEKGNITLSTVIVSDERERNQVGLTQIN